MGPLLPSDLARRTSYVTEIAAGLLVVGIAMLLATCAEGCASPRELPPPCAHGDLAAIHAAYVAETVETCRGRTRKTCAEMPAIEAKYAAKREEWIRCRR